MTTSTVRGPELSDAAPAAVPVRPAPRTALATPACSWTAPERTDRCEGRSIEEHGRRTRACSRRATLRVTGTHRLAADLCATHARVAVDRPRLVREWVLQDDADRRSHSPSSDRPAALVPSPGRVSGEAETLLRVSADLSCVAVVRAALSRALASQGWPAEQQGRAMLAVREAVTNAVEHGSAVGSAIEIGLSATAQTAVVRVVDQGRIGASMPLGFPLAPPASGGRGRGRLLMIGLSERVEVLSGGHGTSVTPLLARDPAVWATPGRVMVSVPEHDAASRCDISLDAERR